ncbi:hypothetical protein [Aquincola sp. J276]|uniref:hypothetical protein n=1 Tax=Aquincola sp. J276 TaxID=2898432 RepID=UPI0021508DA9|nr:hypothetical protein [Aquincola sp. J276]MCR5868616.1 hypothetical protein [Aquincola sp. J276]
MNVLVFCQAVSALLSVVMLTGCTSVASYRPSIRSADDAPLMVECARYAQGPTGRVEQVELRAELRTERPDCYAHSVEATDQYRLFFVEFDEQGRFYDRAQMEQLFAYLDKLRRVGKQRTPEMHGHCGEASGGLSIVTFVHGWRHNARYDDSNVELARKVLRFTATGELARPHHNPAGCPREVVGVYVGWRGLSTTVTDAAAGGLRNVLAPWEWLSVWDRKNTAQNVAVGSVRELFGTLRAYQELRNADEAGLCDKAMALDRAASSSGTLQDRREAGKRYEEAGELGNVYQCLAVRHLIVGHSYGALIVHNAVAQQLVESVTRGRFDDPSGPGCKPEVAGGELRGGPANGRALVRGYADLIVLLNPAIEGARYEPLYEAIAQRTRQRGDIGGFCANQKPVMVVLTSEHDFATRQAFRAVRYANTFFESHNPYVKDRSQQALDYIASEERRSSLRTLGHNERYNTHELVGWRRYLELQTGDAAARTAEEKAEEDRRRYAALLHQPVRSARAQEQYLRMVQRTEQARQVRHDLALNIRKHCPANKSSPVEWKMFCPSAEAPPPPLDACTKASLVDANLGSRLPRRYDQESDQKEPGWSVPFLGGTVLSHLPHYMPSYNEVDHDALLEAGMLPEFHSARTPVWNVMVRDPDVMEGHGDISGEVLVQLLAQLYRAAAISSFHPDTLQHMEQLSKKAGCETKRQQTAER